VARPDRPPGQREGGPVSSPSRPIAPATPPQSRREVASSLPAGTDGEWRRAAWLRLSDERDLHLRLRLDAWREGYQAALSDAVVESLLRIFPAPGHVTEAEKRRYPPDGREHFADPRPGDYPGRRQHG
jgi:hypothetical protein